MNILNLKKNSSIYAIILFSMLLAACGSASDISSKPTNAVVTPGPVTPAPVTPAPVNPNAPVITISAASSSIAYNASTTITWSSTNSTSCSSSPSGMTAVSGTYTTPKLTTTTTYILTCSGTGGSSIGSVKITVAPSAITHFADAGSGNVTVTSANNLSNGAIVAISGTTHYNGNFTATNVTATSFSIVAAFNGDDATGSWQVAGGMIPGCATTGATNAIALSNAPSRFSGVAPLAVFFDATATTATTTTRPFHDLDYRWDFGDAAGSPVSGTTWATTGAKAGVSSRNAAVGAEAGHVFETPGTYTVALTATDGTNTVSNSCAQIVVQDPDVVFAGSNTYCFSTSGTFAGCPAGANQITTSNFASAINTYRGTTRRLLFRRGDTFTGASTATINVNGPGIIGAFGTGAKPVVNGPGTAAVIGLGTYGNGLYSDWRIMDLYLNGQNNQAGENVGINAYGQFNQATILRVDVAGTSTGFAASHWTLTSGQQGFDQWFIHDSTAAGVPGCNWTGHYICNWRVYIVGTHWSMQGNSLDNLADPVTLHAGGSHVIRSEMLQNSVISNNTVKGAGDFQHAIKLHAWDWSGGAGGNATAGVYTEKIIIADNKIQGGANPWLVSIGPQDEIHDERVRDVIFERNWVTSNADTQIHIETSASDSTFRNNIFDLSGSAWHTGISISRRGIEPTPNNDKVYNNTIYSSSTGDFNAINIGNATNITVQNNLGSAPSASNQVMLAGTATQSNNLLNNAPSALFVSATPSTPANFALKSGTNPARDTGLSSVPVLADFFGTSRPQNGAIDIGASEGL